MHDREYRLAIHHKMWLDAGRHFAVGDGGTDLLRAIDVTGSIRAAARRVGWSYRHALAYLDNAERMLRQTLVERTRGGQERGGARLNAAGRDFPQRYSQFRAEAHRAGARAGGARRGGRRARACARAREEVRGGREDAEPTARHVQRLRHHRPGERPGEDQGDEEGGRRDEGHRVDRLALRLTG